MNFEDFQKLKELLDNSPNLKRIYDTYLEELAKLYKLAPCKKLAKDIRNYPKDFLNHYLKTNKKK